MWLLRPLPLLAVAVCLCLAVAGGVTLLGGGDQLTRPETTPATAAPVPHELSPATASVRDRAAVRAVDVLDQWDRSRAAAYSSGGVAALRRLFVRGAVAGGSDVRVLRGYVERGLVVRDLVLQRSEVEVLTSSDELLRVELVERLAGGTVVGPDGEVALPADRLERRVVTLVRGERRWQVAAVVPVRGPSGARPGSGR